MNKRQHDMLTALTKKVDVDYEKLNHRPLRDENGSKAFSEAENELAKRVSAAKTRADEQVAEKVFLNKVSAIFKGGQG